VVIKPGFQDIAGGGGSEIQEVSATPEVSKQKKARKKFLLVRKEVGIGNMKSPFVTDLKLRTEHHYFFLVHEKEIRNTREASPTCASSSAIAAGTIEARMWINSTSRRRTSAATISSR